MKDQKGSWEGRSEGSCRGWGRRIHDQVHEVLLFFMGNESPFEIQLPFLKLEPALTLLVGVCHYKPTIRGWQPAGSGGWQTDILTVSSLHKQGQKGPWVLGAPCSLFLLELKLGLFTLRRPGLKVDLRAPSKSSVWCRGKSNHLEFGRHGFSPKLMQSWISHLLSRDIVFIFIYNYSLKIEKERLTIMFSYQY